MSFTLLHTMMHLIIFLTLHNIPFGFKIFSIAESYLTIQVTLIIIFFTLFRKSFYLISLSKTRAELKLFFIHNNVFTTILLISFISKYLFIFKRQHNTILYQNNSQILCSIIFSCHVLFSFTMYAIFSFFIFYSVFFIFILLFIIV